MSKLLAMVQNENMKIYRRLRTWIMLGILILLYGFITYMMFKNSPLNSSGVSSVMDVVNMSAEFIIFVAIFSAIIAGDIVSSEFGWGTIKLLLIRPISRAKVLLAKYIAVILFAIFFLVVLLAFSYVYGLVFSSGGTSSLTFADILVQYAYKLPDLIFGFTIAFMISAIFRSSALAIGLSIFLMSIGGQIVVGLLARYDWSKYLLYMNTDLTQYREGARPMVEGMTLSFSIMMLIIYYIVFMVLSFGFFNKRDVAN